MFPIMSGNVQENITGDRFAQRELGLIQRDTVEEFFGSEGACAGNGIDTVSGDQLNGIRSGWAGNGEIPLCFGGVGQRIQRVAVGIQQEIAVNNILTVGASPNAVRAADQRIAVADAEFYG